MHRTTFAVVLTLVSAILPGAARTDGKMDPPIPPPLPHILTISAEPASLTFNDVRDVRSIVVTGKTSAGYEVDLTSIAHLHPARPLVSIDSEGFIHPMHVGETLLLISAEGRSIHIPIVVRSVKSTPISFLREVEPAISKIGCNAGICHGAAHGQNGFHLSLRGYDPAFDYQSLIDDVSGRRINRTDPARSLILLKPTETVPHRGGLKVIPGSRYYHILKDWITQGVKSDVTSSSRPDRLVVLPSVPHVSLPGMTQRTVVLAHYPDGTVRDVSRDAVITSSLPDVATVSENGTIRAIRRGEAALMVRYEGNYATVGITVLGDRKGYRWIPQPELSRIDKLVDVKLRKVESLPSPLSDDAVFLRRVSLDLTGLPPGPSEIRAFLSDHTPDQLKRARITDALLHSSAFADRWTNKWADLLDCNAKYMGVEGEHKFRDWLHLAVSENMPYNLFVNKLLTSSGDSYQHPSVNYMRVIADSNTATENVTQLFLGIRFACTKCHDHPFEKWTQSQYYDIGAFFAQVGTKPGIRPDDEVIYDKHTGQNINPATNQPAPPQPPFGQIQLADYSNRRGALAAWLTSPSNPYFARAIVNRIWSYFMGKGIIDPVDDSRADNPPSNPQLLHMLTADFIAHNYNIRHLMREIILTRTYQSSIQTNRWNQDDTINFSHYSPRRLDAEEIYDAIDVATGVRAHFPNLPPDVCAQQLPDSRDSSDGFLDLFGRPARQTACECERNNNMGLVQALDLINGDTVNHALTDPNGRISRMARAHLPPKAMIEEIFLAGLSREPTPRELKTAMNYFQKESNPVKAAQDLMWALINSPAFLFNR